MYRIDGVGTDDTYHDVPLAHHQALGRLTDCALRERHDPEEVAWALDALSRAIEQRLAVDRVRCGGPSVGQDALLYRHQLERVQQRLRQAVQELRTRCGAHAAEVRMRVAELAELVAEYETASRGTAAP